MNALELAKLSVIRRLPAYVAQAQAMKKKGKNATISRLAKHMNLGEDLIRDDLYKLDVGNLVGPYAGEQDMTEILEGCLARVKPVETVMIADGLLGHMLMDRPELLGPGVNLLASFDADEKTGGKQDLPKKILPLYKFTEMVERLQAKVAVLCVPYTQAQRYAELMRVAGITAIWNWTDVNLQNLGPVATFKEEYKGNDTIWEY